MNFDELQGVREKARRLFTEEEATALFLAADIQVKRAHELMNRYWPLHPHYDDIRSSWWLMETNMGNIVIGWRKRVLNIDWESTEVRAIVTDDNVTKTDKMVHAWSKVSAVAYLESLRRAYNRIQQERKPVEAES